MKRDPIIKHLTELDSMLNAQLNEFGDFAREAFGPLAAKRGQKWNAYKDETYQTLRDSSKGLVGGATIGAGLGAGAGLGVAAASKMKGVRKAALRSPVFYDRKTAINALRQAGKYGKASKAGALIGAATLGLTGSMIGEKIGRNKSRYGAGSEERYGLSGLNHHITELARYYDDEDEGGMGMGTKAAIGAAGAAGLGYGGYRADKAIRAAGGYNKETFNKAKAYGSDQLGKAKAYGSEQYGKASKFVGDKYGAAKLALRKMLTRGKA